MLVIILHDFPVSSVFCSHVGFVKCIPCLVPDVWLLCIKTLRHKLLRIFKIAAKKMSLKMRADVGCRYVSVEEKRTQGVKRDNEVLLQRMKQASLTVPYRVIDNPLKLAPEDWYGCCSCDFCDCRG